MITFAELFSGIGGFRLGLEKLGWKCVFANDIDHDACECYRNNFKSDELVESDINNIDINSMPDFDVLVGGFPCQSFSLAGAQLGFEDKVRGTLFFNILSIIKIKKPKALILENVRGLLRHDKGKTISVIVNSLKELGYAVDISLLNAAEFGVPQHRHRTIILAIRNDLYEWPFPTNGRANSVDSINKQYNLNLDSIFVKHKPVLKTLEILGDISNNDKVNINNKFNHILKERITNNPDKVFYIRDARTGDHAIPTWTFDLFGKCSDKQKIILESMRLAAQKAAWTTTEENENIHVAILSAEDLNVSTKEMETLSDMGYVRRRELKDRIGYSLINRNLLPNNLPSKFAGKDGYCCCLVASGISKFGYWDKEIYSLTPRDKELIMGFPEGHTKGFSEKVRTRLLGNAVVPAVISWSGSIVEKRLK